MSEIVVGVANGCGYMFIIIGSLELNKERHLKCWNRG